MVFFSYYANHRKFKEFKKVSISIYPPKWFDADLHFKELAPSANLLNRYKTEELTTKEYTDIFIEETLSKVSPVSIYEKLNGSVCLCFEKSDEFCHRQIVMEWLSNAGFPVREL